MTLPIKPGFPPMEALLVSEIPEGDNWEYEPKWDGFRCLAFRDGKKVELQSKSGQPLRLVHSGGHFVPGVADNEHFEDFDLISKPVPHLHL